MHNDEKVFFQESKIQTLDFIFWKISNLIFKLSSKKLIGLDSIYFSPWSGLEPRFKVKLGPNLEIIPKLPIWVLLVFGYLGPIFIPVECHEIHQNQVLCFVVNEWHGISKQCVQCRKATSGMACQSKLEVNTTKWHWWRQRQGIQHKNLITICQTCKSCIICTLLKKCTALSITYSIEEWLRKAMRGQRTSSAAFLPKKRKKEKKNGTSVGIWMNRS